MRDYFASTMIYVFGTNPDPPFDEIHQGSACIAQSVDVIEYVNANFNTGAAGFRFEAYKCWLAMNGDFFRAIFNAAYGPGSQYNAFKDGLKASQTLNTARQLKRASSWIIDRSPRSLGFNCFTEKKV
jgi:hypothetical protein